MTAADDRSSDEPASCPVCGAEMVWETCWLCRGAGGLRVHCEECNNAGGYLQCSAVPHTDEQMARYRGRPAP